uniref:Uncharacterized protein n=1 Tax=Firmicutes phage HS10 TaxID=3056392 RepID=A0AA49X2F2_9VIRU|nr:MAG: hypothetical protein [Firmicutes phage HS10]
MAAFFCEKNRTKITSKRGLILLFFHLFLPPICPQFDSNLVNFKPILFL